MRWLMLILVAATSFPTYGETIKVRCDNAVGSRLQWTGNPLAPPQYANKLVASDDKIEGVHIQLTFDTDSNFAALVIFGNQNTGGSIQNVKLTRMLHADYFSFVGIDSNDANTTYLLSYFPKVRKLIWTAHASRIGQFDQIALAKQFLMDCR